MRTNHKKNRSARKTVEWPIRAGTCKVGLSSWNEIWRTPRLKTKQNCIAVWGWSCDHIQQMSLKNFYDQSFKDEVRDLEEQKARESVRIFDTQLQIIGQHKMSHGVFAEILGNVIFCFDIME